MWTRNYGALGQTARVCFGVLCANRKKEEETRRPEKKKSEREKEEKSARIREGLIVGGRGEENPRVLLGDTDQESETRMRKNALRTGRRQAVEINTFDGMEDDIVFQNGDSDMNSEVSRDNGSDESFAKHDTHG
ncbi:hypothetical protein TNCV_4336111 [Trichonephila clavipes]|nr:hypothetical protein TNCV_4336111 [Trichonephila clavipes]